MLAELETLADGDALEVEETDEDAVRLELDMAVGEIELVRLADVAALGELEMLLVAAPDDETDALAEDVAATEPLALLVTVAVREALPLIDADDDDVAENVAVALLVTDSLAAGPVGQLIGVRSG